MVRLFIAIELDGRIKRALTSIQRRLAEFDRDVRWTRTEQMHLTLKFLGEVPEEQVEAVCAAAGEVAGQVGGFEMSLGRCGCFPPRGAVRIVHCGVAEETQTLLRCRDLCENAFAELGFERERRPFSGHLTVGRVREDRSGGRLRRAVDGVETDPVTQTVHAVCVVRSQLAPGGATYTNVAQHEMSGGA